MYHHNSKQKFFRLKNGSKVKNWQKQEKMIPEVMAAIHKTSYDFLKLALWPVL